MKLLLTQRAPRARVGRKSLPYSITQARMMKLLLTQRAPRARVGRKSLPYSITQAHAEEYAAYAVDLH